jgi:predicted Zn-dependent protease
MRSFLPCLVVLFAGALTGCAVNPVSGRAEMTLISARQERELGREEAKKVAASMGLVEEPRLIGYVRQVGQRLASHSPLRGDYTFNVVDTPDPNAFALPGGYVYVSRGLLALMNSEDELAGVMGHEVGHVAGRHAAQRVSRAAPIAIISGLGAAVTGVVSPMLGSVIGGVGSLTNQALLAPYGRDQEREADRVGAELEAKAGWDPAGLAAALRTLEREEALGTRRTSQGGSFFATHPPLPERVERLNAFARGLERAPGTPIAGTRRAFVERLAGLVVGQSAAAGVFDGTVFVHPDLGIALTFPGGWKTQNARDIVGASAPHGDAVVALDVAGAGDDPMKALAAIDAEAGSDLARRAEQLDVNGRPAVHVTTQARTEEGLLVLDLTCIAHGGRLYRVMGAARPASAARAAPAFQATARSFRTISSGERARVRETRLRLVQARAGETIPGLVSRTRSTWTADMVAVANGLDASARLTSGQVLKVALSEPYAR